MFSVAAVTHKYHFKVRGHVLVTMTCQMLIYIHSWKIGSHVVPTVLMVRDCPVRASEVKDLEAKVKSRSWYSCPCVFPLQASVAGVESHVKFMFDVSLLLFSLILVLIYLCWSACSSVLSGRGISMRSSCSIQVPQQMSSARVQEIIDLRCSYRRLS